MRIPESAGLGNGPTIIEVFNEKDRSDAEALIGQLKEKVLKNWTQKRTSEEELERIRKQVEDVAKIITLEDAIQMVSMLGEITGKQPAAIELNRRIEEQFGLISKAAHLKSLYLIWRNPFMAAASGTFIDDMMKRCGFENVLKQAERYPALDEKLGRGGGFGVAGGD